jgi:hypothetical protein
MNNSFNQIKGPDNPTCQLLSRSTKHVSKAGKIKEMVEDRLCERAGCDRVVCERVVWKKVVCERFVCMTGMRVCVKELCVTELCVKEFMAPNATSAMKTTTGSLATKRATGASPVPQVPRLPHKSTASATKCHNVVCV